MFNKKLFALALIATAPATAFAADLPSRSSAARAPVAAVAPETMGFYVEGQLGDTMMMDVNTKTYSGSYGGLTWSNVKATISHDNAINYGVEAGLANVFGSAFRVGVSYNTFSAKANTLKGSGIVTYGSDTLDLSSVSLSHADLASLGVSFDNKVKMYMTNGYYDFNAGSAFRPFVGLGIGLADIEHAKSKELALSASLGAQYHFTQNIYVGGKLQGNWVHGPKDEFGVGYENIKAATAMLSLGANF